MKKILFTAFCSLMLFASCKPEIKITYIGTKAPGQEKNTGDIVFTDGSAIAVVDGLELTPEQKEKVAGVMVKSNDVCFIAGKISETKLKWASNSSNLGNTDIGSLTESILSNMTDGREGKERLKAILKEKKKADDTEIEGHYPAWEYCWNYSNSAFTSGWYLPSYKEANVLYNNSTALTNAYKVLGLTFNKLCWSSSAHSDTAKSSSAANYSRTTEHYVIPVHALDSSDAPKFTVTFNVGDTKGDVKTVSVYKNMKVYCDELFKGNTYQHSESEKHLLSFNDQADGKGTDYEIDSYITVTKDMNLYGQWFYGEKLASNKDKRAAGDIVFNDGSLTGYGSKTTTFTDRQKEAAVGVIFYSDESTKTLNNNGLFYDEPVQIHLSKDYRSDSGSASDYTGTRVLLKKTIAAGSKRFCIGNNIICQGNPAEKKSSLNAYISDGITKVDQKLAFILYSANQSKYSLIDGKEAEEVLAKYPDVKLDILSGKPEGSYVPSIMELQIIFCYREMLESQMKKIGGNFAAEKTYYSCNTVPDVPQCYYLQFEDPSTKVKNTVCKDAVVAGAYAGDTTYKRICYATVLE